MKINMVEPEFSRPVVLEKIPTSGTETSIKANPLECDRLAKRFTLLELKKLEATLKITFIDAGQTVKVVGSWEADLVQQCVVSLEPLSVHFKQPIDASYVSPNFDVAAAGSINEEVFETITDGEIDLGELVAQLMGAALDPYPRKAGVPFVEVEIGDRVEGGPMAKLVEFKKKPKDS